MNVVIYRLPINKSLITPRSHCPKCKKIIPIYRNIPIISYLLQKGKCFNCKKNISLVYPIIEFIIGIIWLLSSFYFDSTYEITYFAFIATILIAISVIDYKYFIIPLELSIISLLFIIIHLIIKGIFLSNLFGLIVGTGYLSLIFLLTWLITKKQCLGLGDIHLVLFLGLWFGDIRILLVIFFAALSALLFWVATSYKNKNFKNRPLPFGSFLSIISIIFYLIQFNLINLF